MRDSDRTLPIVGRNAEVGRQQRPSALFVTHPTHDEMLRFVRLNRSVTLLVESDKKSRGSNGPRDTDDTCMHDPSTAATFDGSDGDFGACEFRGLKPPGLIPRELAHFP